MRSGFVAVVGLPNVGKSSLMNRIVGQQLGAISPRPQTTWHQIRGIYTDEAGQIVFVDTPGLHKASDRLNQAMVAGALEALLDADAALMVVDATAQRRRWEQELAALLRDRGLPFVIALNKVDLLSPAVVEERVAELADWGAAAVVPTSATAGTGIGALLEALRAVLPEAPPYYPEDQVSDQPLRFIVSEYVRQAIFEQLKQELPYRAFVEIDEFKEDRTPVYIRAVIYVERNSQKQILIGAKGKRIREIGIRARKLIERLLERPVYLELWVKVLPKWTKREAQLRRAGVLLPGRRLKRTERLVARWQQGVAGAERAAVAGMEAPEAGGAEEGSDS